MIEAEMKDDGLKSCPFCGGSAKLIEGLHFEAPDCGSERIPEFDEFYVQCTSCGMVPNGYGNSVWSTRQDAVKSWNRRPLNSNNSIKICSFCKREIKNETGHMSDCPARL